MTYDEFLYAENDTAARRDFEAKIVRLHGGNWREEISQHDVTIRNLSRIVKAMVAVEKSRDEAPSEEATRTN